MTRAESLRGEYALAPGWTYLNHASYGACPKPVLDEVDRWHRRIERNPHDFFSRRLPALLESVRMRVADEVGLNDPSGLVLQQNATSALATVLAAVPLEEGHELIVTDQEYETVVLAWRRRAQQVGATLKTAVLPDVVDGAEGVIAAIDAVSSPHTRAVLISHITSSTAAVLPVRELGAWARARGILLIVDGAHAPGHLSLNLDDLAEAGVAAYAGDLHKWVSAPRGSGFLWLAPGLRERAWPLVTSWGCLEYDTFTGRHLRRETHDPASMLAVPSAFDFRDRHVDSVSSRESAARMSEVRAFFDRHGARAAAVGTAAAPRLIAATMPLSAAERQRAEQAFLDAEIEVQTGVRNGSLTLRVAIAPYTTENDIERWRDACRAVLRGSERRSA